MKLIEGLTVVSALGAIAAASFAYVAATNSKVFVIPYGSHIGNSPIMASGGSMTFRAVGGWTCDSVTGKKYHTKCVSAQASVKTIDWANVAPPDNTVGTLGWSGLTTPWSLDLWTKANPKGGVRLCTTSTSTISATCDVIDKPGADYSKDPSYVLITVQGTSVAAGGELGLMDSNAAEAGSKAVQYYDSLCVIHDPSKANVIPACEHPGLIDSSIDKQKGYHCRHGGCVIGIE